MDRRLRVWDAPEVLQESRSCVSGAPELFRSTGSLLEMIHPINFTKL